MTAMARALLAIAAGIAAPVTARAECAHLGPALVDHTCFHARFGPFVELAAGPESASGTLDAVHTYYRVRPASAEQPAIVAYTPQRAGEWAFFVQYDAPLAIRAPSGAALAVTHADAVPRCPFLARVQVVALEAGVRYSVAIGPTPASELGVVIEKLDDFVAIHGRDADGDGYGAAADAVVSPCVSPPGYVANDADCDDGDPATHPGAAERCGDPDRNCNGIAGDAGAPCTAGIGACAVDAVAACPDPAGAPVCSAAPAMPGVERCNGIDDDCDGNDDASEALCGDAERPRCVLDGRGGRFCGCETDADCGAPDSARLCFLRASEQRCIDGCVDSAGRNGCPAGTRCTSSDPASPGSCVDDAAPSEDGGGCGCRSAGSGAAGGSLGASALAVVLLRRRRRSAHS